MENIASRYYVALFFWLPAMTIAQDIHYSGVDTRESPRTMMFIKRCISDLVQAQPQLARLNRIKWLQAGVPADDSSNVRWIDFNAFIDKSVYRGTVHLSSGPDSKAEIRVELNGPKGWLTHKIELPELTRQQAMSLATRLANAHAKTIKLKNDSGKPLKIPDLPDGHWVTVVKKQGYWSLGIYPPSGISWQVRFDAYGNSEQIQIKYSSD